INVYQASQQFKLHGCARHGTREKVIPVECHVQLQTHRSHKSLVFPGSHAKCLLGHAYLQIALAGNSEYLFNCYDLLTTTAYIKPFADNGVMKIPFRGDGGVIE